MASIGAQNLENSILDLDINRNVTELISTKGYPVEEYEVETADGFILSLQRIPHGIHQKKVENCKREIILLMHGAAADSSTWVLNFPKQSLGFILADNGYDVWLGNTRGNTYSRKHVKLTPEMKKFWDFSLDEYAAYDLPAMIDFVLSQTKQEQLIYIGMSEGTTSAFALLSDSPEYNQKIKLLIAMAPITTLENMTSSLSRMVPYAQHLAFILSLLGTYELVPPNSMSKKLKNGACNSEMKDFCKTILFQLSGYDPQQLNETRLSVYSTHFLTSSSVRNLLHYSQMVKSKKFQKYDYGKFENIRRYNKTTPPNYDVTKITTPIVLMWGMNDKLADPRDVHELEKLLPSLVMSYRIPYESFTHADFVLAIDAYKLVHHKILTLLCEFPY